MKGMNTKAAALRLGYSVSTLRRWRKGQKVWQVGNKGPKFTEVNGRILYTEEWLDEWQESVWAKVKPE